MFYIEKDNKIILFDKDKEKLKNTLTFMPQYRGLEIKETERPIVDFEFADTEEYNTKVTLKKKERVAKLSMTPLDFIKGLETLGITYQQIKTILDNNEEADKQLRFCSRVYRGAQDTNGEFILDKLAIPLGVTSEELDTLFKTVGE